MNTVMGCCPVSSRLITIRRRAVPFNITIVQAYTPTSDYNDNEIEEFYDQLQNVIDQTPKKDIFLLCKMTECKSGQGYLWKLASHLWTLLQLWRKWERTQTSGVCNKASRRWIWHSPNGQHHSQTDYILVKNCSDQEWTLPGHEVFQEQTLEVTTTCWW